MRALPLAAVLLVSMMCTGSEKKEGSAPGGEVKLETALFAGGCFWCMEAAFQGLDGVVEAVSGYTGGVTENPTYREVCRGTTGHLEAVRVRFDPGKISYAALLNFFWRQFDPTDPGGSFVDRGSQYRSAVFYLDEKQRRLAGISKKKFQASGVFGKPIVTPILPAKKFYPAEAYHQDYYEKSPGHYRAYRAGSGREAYLARLWGKRTRRARPRRRLSEKDLEKILSPLQFQVTRKGATEPPFRNPYWNEKRPGIYVDVASGEPLFSSRDKFDSGTGWPSFSRPLEPQNIVERIEPGAGEGVFEVRSAYAGSHLGHVFPDGPKPSGLRYCINSAALRFVPAEDLEKEGYGEYLSLFRKEPGRGK